MEILGEPAFPIMGWNVNASSCRGRQPPARLFPGFPRGRGWILGLAGVPAGHLPPPAVDDEPVAPPQQHLAKSFTTAIAAVRRMRMTNCSNSVPSRNPAEAILTANLLVVGLFKSVFH